MSANDIDAAVARSLIKSLLQRLVPDERGNYELRGPMTADEYAGLASLVGYAGSQPPSVSPKAEQALYRFGKPANITTPLLLDLDCLSKHKKSGDVVALDFGTAFSKAALWRSGADAPTPLDLGQQVSDRANNLLASSLYISHGAIYFGDAAISVSRSENDPARTRFDSPKQELSILQGQGLDELVDASVDPTRQFTKRNLLTLYLAYLTAASCAALESEGVGRYVLRRFAVPVWKDSQVEVVSKILKRLLVDAQILADSLPLEVWRQGLSANDAITALGLLNADLTDESRDGAKFVEKHVLEAAAAAAAIGEHLSDTRPIVLVVDVGAGTTDIGLYRYALPSADQGRIYPFSNGGAALKIAGDRLDGLLLAFIANRAQLDDQTESGKRSMYVLRRDIRELKRQLFEDGELFLDDIGDIEIRLKDFMDSKEVRQFEQKLKVEIEKLLESVGVQNFGDAKSLFVVVTGGGSKVPIFKNIAHRRYDVSGETVQFQLLDVEPEWLQDFDALTREVFPQLAVAVGACSPLLPEEKRSISDASVAPRRVIAPMYRS